MTGSKPTLTQRVQKIEYAIRDVVVNAKKLEATGRKILYLNIGDPVKYDFDTPPHIKEALIGAVRQGSNWYSDSDGLPELREAICEKEKLTNNVQIQPDNVLVTSGVSESIMMIMGALLESGDEILLPGPSYPPYTSYARFFGGIPVPYACRESEGWRPDLDDLKSKVSKKTRALVIINPNNPCGALYDEATVKAMIEIAAEEDLLLISDEIYDAITYEKKFRSTAALSKDVPVVGVNGFSKSYLMTGWRLGYTYFYDPPGSLGDLKESMEKEARMRLCANTPVQKAAVQAIRGPQDHVRDLVAKLRDRRDYIWKRLNEIKGITAAKPEGAFYMFPKVEQIGRRWKSDKEFVLDLLEKTGVLVVHGSGFDEKYGSGHFRAVFLPPKEMLDQAMNRLDTFMSKV